jgi:hypothetical protein
MRAVKGEIGLRQARLINIRQEPSPELYNVFERADALLKSAKGNTELARRHPTLALEIYHRILRSDLVFIIAGTYDQYRGWMEFEFAVAADLGKPVVAILPPDQDTSPIELQYFVVKTIDWNKDEIRLMLLNLRERRA